jgi:short subunit dehydrogenase-like uncharacterized protein
MRSLDLLVFGVTGFTRRLVAQYLNATYGVGGALAWAIAGRNADKLVGVRNLISAAAALPLLTADTSDAASLAGLVTQAKVIITPNPHERETGRYQVLFIGETANGQALRATVKGDRDPGYGSTLKMITESALCLVNDVDRSTTPGGVWTAGSAMGMVLVRRLQKRAGLSFSIEDP